MIASSASEVASAAEIETQLSVFNQAADKRRNMRAKISPRSSVFVRGFFW
jgi:hypothetical protein